MRELISDEGSQREAGPAVADREDAWRSAHGHADPRRLLALQRSAGNSAVAGSLTRAPTSPAAGAPDARPLVRRAPAPGLHREPASPSPEAPSPAAPGGGERPRGEEWSVTVREWDWGITALRVPLELGRMIPFLGLASGLTADVLQGAQELASVSGVAPPWLEMAMVARTSVNIVNNGLGHFAYIGQLAQDGAGVSGVLSPLIVFTGTFESVLLLLKMMVDYGMAWLDLTIGAGALYEAMRPPPGGAAGEQALLDLSVTYLANSGVDILTLILDTMDFITAGVTNIETGESVAKPLFRGWLEIAQGSDYLRAQGMAVVVSMLNVLGAPMVNAGRHALDGGGTLGRAVDTTAVPDAATQVAVGAALEGIGAMRSGYEFGDMLIAEGASLIEARLTELRETVQAMMDGRDPFLVGRDAVTEGLANAEFRLGQLSELAARSADANTMTESVVETADEAIAGVEGLELPEIDIPEADLGEGAAADAAEFLLDTGAGLVEGGAQAVMDELQGVLDEGKALVVSPLQDLRANAAEVGGFLAVLAEVTAEQVELSRAEVEDIAAKLGECEGFEDVFDLMIDMILETLGIEADFDLADVGEAWRGLADALDSAEAWVRSYAAGGTEEPPLAELEAAAAPVAPGGDDDEKGGGGGAAGGG